MANETAEGQGEVLPLSGAPPRAYLYGWSGWSHRM